MNAIFDLEIALCLIIGIGIGKLAGEDSRSVPGQAYSDTVTGPNRAAWCGLLLVLTLGLHLPRCLLEVRELWEYGPVREVESANEIAFLARQPGPVACEDLSLCYWAGKDFEIDFFLLGQKLSQGLIDPHVVIQQLRSHYYAAIQTNEIDGKSSNLPLNINQAIADNYEVARTTMGAVLVPRRQ